MTDFFRGLAAGLIAAAFTSAAASAQTLTPPAVPGDLQPPAGNTLFLKGAAQGTQNYICLPAGAGFAWTFYSPDATLFTTFKFFGNDVRQQIVTHFLSPNPEEGGTPRPTWQGSLDTSVVRGKVFKSSTDTNFVAPGAIAWLLLEKAGTQVGPSGDLLARTTYIQRVNTAGGIAPTTGCSAAANVGAVALVPYAADYFFYRKSTN